MIKGLSPLLGSMAVALPFIDNISIYLYISIYIYI